jgi:hypothetical protein
MLTGAGPTFLKRVLVNSKGVSYEISGYQPTGRPLWIKMWTQPLNNRLFVASGGGEGEDENDFGI